MTCRTSGVGVAEVLPSTTAMMSNRAEVLKCLLACLSESIYQLPGKFYDYHTINIKL